MADDRISLARRIVSDYRSQGIPARSQRGYVFVEKEEGWEGPFDPCELAPKYQGDIVAVLERVKGVFEELNLVRHPSNYLALLPRSSLKINHPAIHDGNIRWFLRIAARMV